MFAGRWWSWVKHRLEWQTVGIGPPIQGNFRDLLASKSLDPAEYRGFHLGCIFRDHDSLGLLTQLQLHIDHEALLIFTRQSGAPIGLNLLRIHIDLVLSDWHNRKGICTIFVRGRRLFCPRRGAECGHFRPAMTASV